jgi:hypothetical protein
MACFKMVVKVNGFLMNFMSWGREDTEHVVRLLNAEIVRKNIKFNAGLVLFIMKDSKKKCCSGLVKSDQ